MSWLDDPDFIKLLNLYTEQMREKIALLEDEISIRRTERELQSELLSTYRSLFFQERQSNLISEQSLLLTAKLQHKYPITVFYSPN